ncbi:CHAT domain protein (plasmid) [Gemmatirosa kalamazoonensis]|uniref:CHAT domain protein n=1 Tax=Gemmatirosa kalamazoonensis TaxID=861299 RepID=W0RMQ8_9BACT|nr:CHAT domain protein [Gemmatirosa kalamazoonensis]
MRPRGGLTALPRFTIALVVAVVGLVFLRRAQARHADATAEPTSAVAALRALPAPRRLFAARLSLPQSYAPCDDADTSASRRTTCATPAALETPSQLAHVLAVAAARGRTHVDVDALHALALGDLAWAHPSPMALDRSVAQLRTAARLLPNADAALIDLSAALLVRADRRHDARDLFDAAEQSARAVSLDSTSAPARFDLALALTRLGFGDAAERAWRDFLAVESTGPWADEARRRLAAIEGAGGTSFRADDPDVAHAVRRDPQGARLHGWDVALRTWGDAMTRGDTAAASRALTSARAIGRALESQGDDATLIDAVRVIDAAAGDAARTRALAIAHRAYADGYADYAATRHAAAAVSLRRATDAPGPLGAWARVFAASTVLYAGDLPGAERALRREIERADSARHPALVARARWSLGHALIRLGRSDSALRELRAAADGFARAHESEDLGAVQTLAAHAAYLLGDSRLTASSVSGALTALRAGRRSGWRYNALYMTALAAESDGLLGTARIAADEGVAVAARTGNAALAAEALVVRAQLAMRAGADGRARAAADAMRARATIADAPASSGRDWIASELSIVELTLRPPEERARSFRVLDSVVAMYERPVVPPRLIPALLVRADTRTEAGDARGAAADLDRAVALLAREQRATDSLPLRASLVDAARGAVDRAVMYYANRGDAASSLRQLETGRAGLERSRVATDASPIHARPGETALVYALVGDTLLTWTVRGSDVRLKQAVVAHDALVRTAEGARAALELRTTDDARVELARLYDWLARPVRAQLGPDGTRLVLVADGELSAVPFAALLDTARGRYLVEDFVLRDALTLRGDAPPTSRAADGDALVIADPAFDRAAYPALAPLTGARVEARTVSERYARARVIGGADATPAAVSAALRRVSVVHYAGHAVFDDDRPERSMLLLAGPGGGLTAERIASLPLERVRLVVLSACETLRSTGARGGGSRGSPAHSSEPEPSASWARSGVSTTMRPPRSWPSSTAATWRAESRPPRCVVRSSRSSTRHVPLSAPRRRGRGSATSADDGRRATLRLLDHRERRCRSTSR